VSALPGLALVLGAALAAQSPGDQPIPLVTYPELPRQGQEVASFVPKGWKLETRADGDLNGDGLADAALVLRMTDPRNLVSTDWDPEQKYDSNPRILAVLFARKGGGYNLAVANHEIIPRLENQNQEDPFDGVEIRRGTLRLRMHIFMSAGGWWMGNLAFTFRWQDGGFKLIGFNRNGVQRNTGETDSLSINFLTRERVETDGHFDGRPDKVRRSAIPAKPLIDLSAAGDGLMYDPSEP
jgi:hypothetical protein